jgi:hypothetical protein
MNETTLSTHARQKLEMRLPNAVVIKPQDRFTPGIPDMVVAVFNHTFWFEFKKTERGELLKESHFKPLQLPMLDGLERETNKAWIVLYGLTKYDEKFTHVLRPSIVWQTFKSKGESIPLSARVLDLKGWDTDVAVRMIARSVHP